VDRLAWLQEVRRSARGRYDTLYSPTYDEEWGAIAPTHRQFLGRFLDLCPPQGHLLDAACGTGKYWPLILASGRTVLGTDQSQGMLARAHEKLPAVPIDLVGLQELAYQGAFDGAICIDALEMVFPEDWLLVLRNLHRAIRPQCYAYFAVELAAEADVESAFLAGRQLGLPLVYGESAHEGRYHYYPKISQVREWVGPASFRLVDEAVGDEYHHFLVVRSL